jgi:hypothetical protein
MGLAIVHGIVHTYDGHIVVDRDSADGTSISIILPAALIRNSAIRDANQVGQTMHKHGAGARVLIVDDEPAIANYLGELLARN